MLITLFKAAATPQKSYFATIDKGVITSTTMNTKSTNVNDNDNGTSQPRKPYFNSDIETQNMPPSDWLIEDILLEESTAILAAPGESGKTLLVLDWCMCIASHMPWNGRKVRGGIAVYVTAEGVRGFGKRLKAWKKQHGIPEETSLPIHIHYGAVQLLETGSMTELCAALDSLPEPPAVVVFDTLSQCTLGIDENAPIMASAIASADLIREKYHCTVIILHHTTKDGRQMRGFSGIRDNLDTQIMLTREKLANVVTARCFKQRDEDHFAEFKLQFKKIALSDDGKVSSAVLVPEDAARSRNKASSASTSDENDGVVKMNTSQRRALAALVRLSRDIPATSTNWMNATGLKHSPFNDARRFLTRNGYVNGGGGEKGVPYHVTMEGGRYFMDHIARTTDDILYKSAEEDEEDDAA